jgi:anti-sigma regulatory factor (Ser/Thr protein kinase)
MDRPRHLRHAGPPANVKLAEHAPAGRNRADSQFHHEALFYSGADGFLEGVLPFVDDALAAEEPVLVAAARDKIDLLRHALGRDAGRVSFEEMPRLGSNPARIIPAWHRFLNENGSAHRSVRGVGEPIWPGRSAAELTECQRQERLLNLAFGGGTAWRLLCPYDLHSLDDQVIEASRCSHPFVAEDGQSRASGSYPPVDAATGPFDGSLPPPPAEAAELHFTDRELGALRQLVLEWASAFELSCERTEHLILAVTELASNSVRHGGGSGTMRLWREEDTLLVEIRDRGHIEEPLAGRIRPSPAQATSRGLWLVNQLCDLVQIRSAPGRTVVRVHMHLI